MLKAYKVWCDDPDSHGQSVRFAERGKDVDRHANDCDCEFVHKHVTRAPEFDKYAPGPVTIRQYLAEGWHWECSGCGRHVYEDDNPVIIRGHVYHSRQCVARDLEDLNRWHKRGQRLHESLVKHLAAIRRWLRTHDESDVVAESR